MAFRKNFVVSQSVEIRLNFSTFEDTNTTLFRNVRDKSPSDAALRLRKTDVLFTPLLKP